MKKFVALIMGIMLAIPVFCMPADREMTFADGFNGASLENTVRSSIQYADKQEEAIEISGRAPRYYDVSDRDNTCANVAGTILLGYYDKDYDERIENFTSARVIRGRVTYYTQTQEVQNAMARLYTTMKTNVTEGGTTVNNFKAGLQQYVNEHGRKIVYTKTVNNQSLQTDVYRDAIENKIPSVFCLSKYTLISEDSFSSDNGVDNFTKQHYVGNHMVIGYGLKIIRYFDAAGNLKQQLTLLEVATGYERDPIGYILLDDYGTLVDGYTVRIY